MPELFFDIRFNANESDLKTVKDEANRIQKEVNQSLEGDASKKTQATEATREQAKAEKELYNEFKRQVTVNEVKFRQGELSQKQALENAESIERQAIETGVLTDQTLRGARAQKTMFLSQQRIQTGFTGMAQTSARANQSLMNLGRIVQDLPFGFLGISNNIDPALNSFRQLKEESGSTGGAFKALLGSLKGSGGLIFALGSLLPTAVLIAQKGFNMYRKRTNEAKKETDALGGSIKRAFRGFDDTLDDVNIDKKIDIIASKLREMGFEVETITSTQENIDLLYRSISGQVIPFWEQSSLAISSFSTKSSNAVNNLKLDVDALNESLLEQQKAQARVLATDPSAYKRKEQLDALLETQEEINEKVTEELKTRLAQAKADKEVLNIRRRMNIESAVNVEKMERGLREAQSERLQILLDHTDSYKEKLSLLKQQKELEEGLIADKIEQLNKEKEIGDISREEYVKRLAEIENERLRIILRYQSERNQIQETEQERVRARQEAIRNMPESEGDETDESRYLARAQMQIKHQQEMGALNRQLTQARLARELTLNERLIQAEQEYVIEQNNINQTLFSSEIQLEQARLNAKKSFLQRQVEIERAAAQEMVAVQKMAGESRVAVERAVISAIQSISQGLAEKNKGLAIALLAVEKGLAISRVAIEGAEKVSRAQALASFYTAQSITPFPPFVNPAAVAAAINAQTQVGIIKASTAANIAAIAAQGLGEAINISNRGSRSGGSASGGAGGSSGEYGFFTTGREIKRPQNNQSTKLEVSFEDGVDEVIAIKAQNGAKKIKKGTIFVTE